MSKACGKRELGVVKVTLSAKPTVLVLYPTNIRAIVIETNVFWPRRPIKHHRYQGMGCGFVNAGGSGVVIEES